MNGLAVGVIEMYCRSFSADGNRMTAARLKPCRSRVTLSGTKKMDAWIGFVDYLPSMKSRIDYGAFWSMPMMMMMMMMMT